MSFSEWSDKKKKQAQEEQDQIRTANTKAVNGNKTTFGEWSDNKVISNVSQDYINSFIEDVNKFNTIAPVDSINWNNASSARKWASLQSNVVRDKATIVRKWLNANQNNVDEETYKSLSGFLDDLDKNLPSMLESYENLEKFYAQFDSEDSYKKWTKAEEERQAVLNAEDFEEITQLGTSVENPAWNDTYAPLDIFGWKPFGSGAEVSNMVTFAEANKQNAGRDSGQAMLGGGGGNQHTPLIHLINTHMTDEEKSIYNYYIGKGDKAKADEYLNSLKDVMNQRQAQGWAEQIDNTAFEAVFSAMAGIDNAMSGFKNLDNFFMGTEADTTSAIQYAQGMMSSNNEGIWKVTNDLANTTGNMLPSILVGTVTGGLGGAVTLGTSAVGNGYSQMRNLGYNEGQSRAYGALVGASESVLQYFLGGISKLGGGSDGIFQTIAGKILPKLDNALARVAITLGGNMLDEGLEEIIQEMLDPVIKMAATGEDFEGINWEEVWYSGLLGALSAGTLEGIRTIPGTVLPSISAKKLYGDISQELVTEALAINPGNDHASRMQQRLDNGKKLSGYQLNRLVEANEESLYSQDFSKIKNATASRLTEVGEKGDVMALAEALTKKAAGEKLTLSEKKAIKKSQYGKRVSNELSPRNIKSGEYSSGWAETLGTERINVQAYNKDLDITNTLSPTKKINVVTDDEPEKEIATETKFKVSESGETSVGDTQVNIKEIASIKDGELTLRLDNGETVSAKDVEFSSNDEGLLYENVVDMGLNAATANAFVKGYDPSEGLSVQEYALGFREAYRYGEYGFPAYEMSKDGFSALLHEAKRNLAYDLGKTDAKYRVSVKQDGLTKATASKQTNKGGLHNTITPTNERQKASLKALRVVAESLGIDIYTFESKVGKDGKRKGANGWYDPTDNSIHIDLYAGANGESTMLFTAAHELTHFIKEWSPAKFKAFADFLFEQYGEKGVSVSDLVRQQIEKAKKNGRDISYETAYEEVVADACETMLTDSNAIEKLAELKKTDKTLWQKIKDFITNLVARIKKAYAGMTPDSVEASHVRQMLEAAEKLQALWTEALMDASANYNASDFVGFDTDSESVSPMFSERTWSESEYVLHRDQMAEKISKALGVSLAKAKSYIDDINSIAKMIADDRVRLDYEASSFGSAFVSNVEYGGSFDYTTLCKKRRIYTGTFTEIQKRLKDVALTPDDILAIRNLLIEEGIEATCGLCYVEGSRANMGKFAKEFIRLYKRDNPDAWIPNMADVNTPDGVEQMRINHPEAYDRYEYFWNHYGKLKDSDPALFASQQKPKLYESRKEYKGEILEHFKGDNSVLKKNLNGGIRMQSFSDFEIVHLIDTMQVIMDMSTVGLAGQAYTKVPEFAKAFGNTGLKINLSLIAKGVDADGNLIFDDREGMPHQTAFDLRNKYSKNVGTIIVTFTDAQLLAAMSDPRIDYIIPFHRSQWKKGQYGAMGLPKGTKDYTFMQNEKLIKQTYHEYQGRQVKDKATNYMPNEYWDFSKSGKENAEAYLKMCAENNKRPKFYKLLDYDGEGTYSLKKDGSTDGYWKLLIDFKMYDNDGVGSPQMAVTPTFNMDEARTMLDEYKGGHNNYPVASAVVDEFVNQYNKENKTKYSDRDSEGNTLSAEQQEYFKDSKVRDKKGNLMVMYHGTTANFNTFKKGDVGFHFGTKGAARGRVGFGKNVTLKEVYLNITNPIVLDEDLGSWDADYELTKKLFSMNILTRAEAESVLFTDNKLYRRSTEEANKKLSALLQSKGYDGIAYKNTHEGKKDSTSYIVFNSNQAKEITNKAPTANPDIRYSDRDNFAEDKYFKSQMSRWEELKHGSYVNVGTIGEKHPLCSVGMPEGILRYDVDKLKKNMVDHGDYLDVDLLKTVPDIIANPIAISEFSEENTVSVFGDVFVRNSPMMVGVTISKDKAGNDISKVRTFNARRDVGKLITDETILYLNEDKKRTRKWFQACGIQVPLGETKFGFIRIISQKSSSVKSKFSDRNSASFKGKPFWSGSVSLLDGVIEEVHSFNEAEAADFHHTMYFSQPQIEKMESGENAFFFVENGKVEGDWRVSVPENIINRIKEQIDTAPSTPEAREFADADIKYSIREEAPPKKTVEGYKVFVVKNGKLYPPMVANPNAEDTPVGVWLNADVGTRAPDSKTGRMQVKAGGKGTQGGSGSLAFRPGWHLGETPLATQFDRLNPETGVKELFPENFVWALCDIAADHDYQEEAMSYGYTKNGKFQHSLAGLPKLPTDGYYKYRTNPNPDTVPWLITGAMKVKKLLSDAEVNAILESKGLPPKKRVGGDKTLADLGLSEYDGKFYSDRDPDSASNRTLLANALESVAQNDIERDKLTQYKDKIALIESEQKKLSEIRAKIKELSFAKGARDTKAIHDLQFEANQTANRINTYDKQLLSLESTKALKGVLEREKAMLRKRLERQGKEALFAYKERAAKTQRELLTRVQESRKNAIEGRHRTEMRHKIKNVVSDLNKLLLNPTKEQHVPIGLQKVVAEALDAINMDTMKAEERVAYYNDLIAKTNDPDKIAEYTSKRDFFAYRDMNFKDRITALKNAYSEFKESDDPLVRNAHNEAIEDLIKNTADAVGNKSLKDMSMAQLEAVYNMYKAILATVRNTNKMFKEGRQATITENSEAVKTEVREIGGHKDRVKKATKGINSFVWNSLKPIFAFKRIGSDTLTDLYENVRAGEDTYATDISEAMVFYEDKSKKYKLDSWDFKKQYSFKDSAGNEFSLSLEQIMSLYAYSKREQADKHLEFGGFVFDDAIEVTEKNKFGIPVKYEVNDATPYRLRKEDLGTVISALDANQKAFIDEMQTYLSETMGAKGNEVTLAMYDIKLFKELNYFPLKTSRYFREYNPEQSGNPMLRNSGFTKKTVPQAGNPIVLANFMDVWTSHVNDMSMYHSFVLPLEDFMRVYNYSSTAGGYDSVQQYIKNAYGANANQYIEKLMQDINGGVTSGNLSNPLLKMFSKFKKVTVAASLSTIVQQPTAILRAMALINPKYFVGVPFKDSHKKTWNEIKQYAPIAIIKEMGGIDVGSGRQAKDYIQSNRKGLLGKIDDVFMWGATKADELGWNSIWKAVKREVASTQKLKPGTEEFFKACGKRFTEVVTQTQVYDSVFSRSGFMRDKGDLNKFATSFLGEPTTSFNMLFNAILSAKRGGSKVESARVIGSVYASIIGAAAMASLVYALRDDDEDEAYLEKYAEALGNKLSSEIWIHNMLPYIRDIASIIEGWDVERPDMSIFSDIKSSFDKLFKINDDGEFEWKIDFSDPKSVYSAVENFGGSIASAFGLPLKNILRDTRAIFNGITAIFDDIQPSDIGGAFIRGFTGDEAKKSEKLYDAIINGDDARLEVLKKGYKTEQSYESAVRSALRENDSRINEAAQARMNGDIAEYTRIAKEIIREGNFSQDTVVAAINAEINALKKGEGKTETNSSKDKVESIYSVDDYFSAISSRDISTAYAVKDDIIRTEVANGKDHDEAEANFNSKFANHLRDMFDESNISYYEAVNMLVDYGGKSNEDASSKVQYWQFKQRYPDYDLTEDAVSKYYSEVEPWGINVSTYYDYVKGRANCKGTDYDNDGRTDSGSVKAEVMAVIDSLPITSQQKDALYYLNGWSQSTIYQAPWR